MRAHRVLGLGFVTALGLLAACTSTENHEITVCPDASVPEASPDTGPTTPVHTPVTSPVLRNLQIAGNVELIGITSGVNPHAVYWVVHYGVNFDDPRTWDLMAAPIWGGTGPITIATALDDDDPAVVNGGAVAWWTTASSDSLAATSIGIWTPEHGPQTLTTNSFAGLFAATQDGSTVVYSAASTASSTPMFVTPSNALTATGAQVQGANVVNLLSDSPTCEPQLHFAQQTLIMSYCAGSDANQTAPSLLTVIDGKVVTRVPQANDLSWSSDLTGQNIFINDPSTGNSAILVLAGDQTTTTNIGVLSFGQMLKSGVTVAYDGTSFLTYRPDGTKTVVSAANFLLAASPDDKLIAFSKNTSTVTTTDIQIADISQTPPKLTTIVNTTNASFVGFTGDSQHVIYNSPLTQDQVSGLSHGPLLSQPVGGGAVTTLADDSYFTRVALAGTGLVATSAASTDDNTLYRETFGYVDGSKGGQPSNVSSILRFTEGIWFDRTFVYEDLGVNAGLYALEVP